MTDTNTQGAPRGFVTDLAVRAASPSTWALTEDLTWTGALQTFTVPAGFGTDFATSPRFLHWLWLPYGAYTRAAVLHDYLLADIAQQAIPLVTSRDADAIFRVAMRDLGVGWPRRWMGWTAVRWGALFNSRRAYGRGFGRDLPRVLGVSLLVLPVALPGALGVLLSLGMVRIVTMPSDRPRKRGFV